MLSSRDAVLLLAALLFLPFLGSRDFWAPDEARYAQVAQEMVAGTGWWQPQLNGRPYRDKPPLYFWTEAALSLPFGHVNEWTARLPSVLCGLLVVLLLFDLGRRLPLEGGEPETAAIAAALAFATCWLGAWMTRRVNLDVPLTAAAVGAVWAAWCCHEAARDGRRSWPWALLAGVSTALGVMVKGPVVLLPVAGAAAALAAARSFRRERARGHAGPAWAAGLAGFAGVLVAWLVPAAVFGGYDAVAILNEHVIDRAAKGLHHARPPWYYLKSLPLDFLPWTLVAVPALGALLRRRARRQPADGLLLGWLLVPLVVLSVVVEKRNIYLLPALPALCLIVGRWLARCPREGSEARALRACGAAAGAVLGLLALVAAAVAVLGAGPPLPEEAQQVAGLRWAAAGLGTAALGGLLLLAAGFRRGRGPRAAAWALALAFGAVELTAACALPLFDVVKSPRAAGRAIAEATGAEPLAAWPLFRAGYAYYSDRRLAELQELDELEAWLAAQPRPAWVLSFDESVAAAPADRGVPPEVVWQGGVGHRHAMLLRYGR